MGKPKKYEGFRLGRSWVSRCGRCGHICFTVAEEQEHDLVKCDKRRLDSIPESNKDFRKEPGNAKG